ncbi:MAG: phosphodiester glycosidase family protein [Verrucomicrobiaceae bacterium]|nr:MAG: phosphodiester glycosidase family protein [Verrucomicrobiaceae bacterium]
MTTCSLLALSLCLLISVGVQATEFEPLSGSGESEWKPLYQGIDYRLSELQAPRRLRIHEVRIDTRAAGVSFFTTPDNGDRSAEVDGRKTTTFLEEFDVEIAINGSGFEPIAKEGISVNVIGLSVSNGRKVSGLVTKQGSPVFLATADQQVRILAPPFSKGSCADAHNALQGWYGAKGMLLDDGKVVTDVADIHPRTAAGVSQDGRHMILLVADGRQPGRSEGMNLVELAEWMQKSGCWDAMNLDGGGSSTMVVKGIDGKPQVLNSPSGGSQRSVGNHLGVHALPLAR